VARHLFIVSREQPGLFSYLKREFASEPEVTVILDRRQAERRSEQEPEAAVADRRQGDRRLQAEIMGQLATLGYAFVRLAPTVVEGRVTSASLEGVTRATKL
jgi:hypothetical protein